MPNLKQAQEIIDRGAIDQLPPNKQSQLQELIRRGVLTAPQATTISDSDPNAVDIPIGELDGDGKIPDPEDSTFSDSLKEAEDFVVDLFGTGLNTASFGLGDIVAGMGKSSGEFVKSLISGEEVEEGDLAEAFKEPRRRRLAFAEKNPKTAIAASIAGGFFNPVANKLGLALKGTKGFLPAVKKGVTTGAKIGGAQATGEETGNIIGQIASDEDVNIGESLKNIGIQTAIGAGTGGVVPVIGQTFKASGRAIKNTGILDLMNRFTSKKDGAMATRKVVEALQRDGFTPSQALKMIDKLGPEAALLDAGPNTRALGFTTAGIPGEGKKKVTEFIRTRQEGALDPETKVRLGGQVKRIQENMDELIPDNFFNATQRIENMNKHAVLYDEAIAANKNIMTRELREILATPAGKTASNQTAKFYENLRRKDIKPGDLEWLDRTKRILWDLEQVAKKKEGANGSEAISTARTDLITELDRIDLRKTGGKYSEARGLAGDKLGNQEALEKGSKFIKSAEFKTPEQLNVVLEKMSPETKHYFRLGAAQALKTRLAELPKGADATKQLLGKQVIERKTQLAFDDPNLFKSYMQMLENEETLFKAVTDVLSNSQTAARSAALSDVKVDPGRVLQGFQQIVSGAPVRGTVNVVGGIKDRALISESQSKELGNLLTGRDISKLKTVPPREPAFDVTPGGLQESLIRSGAFAPSGVE